MNNDILLRARQLQRQVEVHQSQLRETKDAVLHLRIESEVMERIKAEAQRQKLSVSDLVRRHLAAHFAVNTPAEGVQAFLASTFAWSDAVLSQDTRCAVCGAFLARGSHARLANGPPPPARLVCDTCFEQFQQQPEGATRRDEGTE